MADIKCPAPDCTTTWPAAIALEVLLKLIDLHERTTHPSTVSTPSPVSNTKAEKVKQPVILAAGTSEEWAYFQQRWSDYKAATHLTGSDVVYQLFECCDENLQKDLTRSFGALANKNEANVLQSIKTLAVRQENIMVARVQLQQMR
ncbi:RNA helicase [Plakobranchus ocellatus]|uniref:RNA helicase n=1 Tax=Plakobranchus ocellatus TaxID=259542 RepID=A0AAV4A852_9GAST|nr:RNA helicase [Plakobranchus ocellatus]